MKKIIVLVASKRELSSQVSDFLTMHGCDIFEIGIGVSKSFISIPLSRYEEVWNIGSVGSKLPLYSVFEVGCVSSDDSSFLLSDSAFSVKTVDSFIESSVSLDCHLSYDMELIHIYRKSNSRGKKVRSFKYVSDNMDGTVNVEGWHSKILEAAFVVSEPLICLLKKAIIQCQKEI